MSIIRARIIIILLLSLIIKTYCYIKYHSLSISSLIPLSSSSLPSLPSIPSLPSLPSSLLKSQSSKIIHSEEEIQQIINSNNKVKVITEKDVLNAMSVSSVSSTTLSPLSSLSINSTLPTFPLVSIYDSPLEQIRQSLNLSPIKQLNSNDFINNNDEEVQVKELTYFYLKKELKIPKSSLDHIMMKNSWVLYLR